MLCVQHLKVVVVTGDLTDGIELPLASIQNQGPADRTRSDSTHGRREDDSTQKNAADHFANTMSASETVHEELRAFLHDGAGSVRPVTVEAFTASILSLLMSMQQAIA